MMKTLLLAYLVFIIVAFLTFVISEFKGNGFAITPKEIYDCNNFNMLAAWVLCIIFIIINPCYCLYKGLCWLFHYERKE